MFYLGLAAILLVALLLGLTVLRLLENRPSPNAELLAELMDSLDQTPPQSPERSRPDQLSSKTEHA